MNEDDVLGQLRDIHLPENAVFGSATGFALWPFIVLGTVICLVLIIRYWNAARWRRAARRDLADIMEIEDPAERWQNLLAFASSLSDRSGRTVSLPETAFQRPEILDDAIRFEFVQFLRAEIRR